MRISSLLLAGLGSLPLVHSTNIYYRPASGYYTCPKAGMVCNVVGCDNDNCSILSNGFGVSSVEGRSVYTSTKANADISITGDDSTAIDCDISCYCQFITNGVGCNVPISDGNNDPFEKGIVEEDGKVSQLNIDGSSANMMAFGGSVVLATALSFML